jgi:hypothetical protein
MHLLWLSSYHAPATQWETFWARLRYRGGRFRPQNLRKMHATRESDGLTPWRACRYSWFWKVREFDAQLRLCYHISVTLSRILFGAALTAALSASPLQLPVASCILSNAPSTKACMPGSCANKACCKTSQKSNAAPVQPMAKSGSDQQNIAALPTVAALVGLWPAAGTSSVFSSRDCKAHSPPTLAFICIRLI